MEAVSTIHKQPVYEDDDLHTARKCIKDVIYIIKIYQDDMQLPLPFMPWNKKELQKAEHIAHILGLFNDARIELDLLQSVCISKPGSHNIYSKWQKEKSKLKNKAVRSLCANHIYK